MMSLTRLIIIVLCGLWMTALSPAHAASLGRTTVGAIPSGGLRADFKRGSKFILAEKGTLLQVCAHLDAKGGGSGYQEFRYAVYRDQNGVPAEQVAQTFYSSSLGAPNPTIWYCLPTAAVLVEAGTYWLMIHTGHDPGVIRYYHDGAANWYGNTDTYADGTSDTFGPGSVGEGTVSIYAEYLPESQARHAGRTTIGTRVSRPMSADHRRGSSFVLNEAAQLLSLNAYVDGLGGTTGSQPLTLALYDDLNGVPNTLIAKAQVQYASGVPGRSGRWVSAREPNWVLLPQYLVPGQYWIVLETGAPAGVLRYYLEGTGNWRGASAASAPNGYFGASTPGSGTITASMLYAPTKVRVKAFGRTTQGTVPSGGLRANHIRGSNFDAQNLNWPQPYGDSLTALYAYMDGKGATTGSQKVRLSLWERYEAATYINHVVMSDEVTIPAGRPAGWVRFPVPRTAVAAGSYFIMMSSGETAGVARYYASNDQDNWRGAALTYPNAPPQLYLRSPPSSGEVVLQSGNTTLSLYGEFLQGDYTSVVMPW